jgi:hypothetical protein
MQQKKEPLYTTDGNASLVQQMENKIEPSLKTKKQFCHKIQQYHS